MSSKIAKRYAKALFLHCQENKKLDIVYKDIKNIEQLDIDVPDFYTFIKNPTIEIEEKQKILTALFKDKIHGITQSFLLFLAEKGRLKDLGQICVAFEDCYNNAMDVLKVEITSSEAMQKSQSSALIHHLKLKFRKEIQSYEGIDQSLIGGLKLRIKDLIYDFSIKTQLENFKNKALHI